MNSLVPKDDSSSNTKLTKTGIAAVSEIAGGALLIILRALPTPLAIVAGCITAVVGLSSVFSSDPVDKKAGALVFFAGACTLLTRLPVVRAIPLLPAIAGLGLAVGSVAMIGLGIWNGIKFISGLKARS
jgi:hypothetical protein